MRRSARRPSSRREHFVRLAIEEPQAHGPPADDAFEVADAAAPAVFLARVEADDDVAAFPDAVGRRGSGRSRRRCRASRRESGRRGARAWPRCRRHRVGVVQTRAPARRATASRQRGLQLEAFDLAEVRGVLDDAAADDARESRCRRRRSAVRRATASISVRDRLGDLVGGHARAARPTTSRRADRRGSARRACRLRPVRRRCVPSPARRSRVPSCSPRRADPRERSDAPGEPLRGRMPRAQNRDSLLRPLNAAVL